MNGIGDFAVIEATREPVSHLTVYAVATPRPPARP
jgi:hypothetical protein